MSSISDWPADMMRRDASIVEPGEGHGSIQWKGTGVCIDIHCRCGHHAHMDVEFLYFYQCPLCLDKFALGCDVRLYALTGNALVGYGDRVKRPDLLDEFGVIIAEGSKDHLTVSHADDELNALRAEVVELRRKLATPTPVIVYCPRCGAQHVDAPHGDWTNPPHRSHECQTCKLVWRVADVPTAGVERTQISIGGADMYYESLRSRLLRQIEEWAEASNHDAARELRLILEGRK